MTPSNVGLHEVFSLVLESDGKKKSSVAAAFRAILHERFPRGRADRLELARAYEDAQRSLGKTRLANLDSPGADSALFSFGGEYVGRGGMEWDPLTLAIAVRRDAGEKRAIDPDVKEMLYRRGGLGGPPPRVSEAFVVREAPTASVEELEREFADAAARFLGVAREIYASSEQPETRTDFTREMSRLLDPSASETMRRTRARNLLAMGVRSSVGREEDAARESGVWSQEFSAVGRELSSAADRFLRRISLAKHRDVQRHGRSPVRGSERVEMVRWASEMARRLDELERLGIGTFSRLSEYAELQSELYSLAADLGTVDFGRAVRGIDLVPGSFLWHLVRKGAAP